MNFPAPEQKPVLAGQLSDFDLASLLQVVSTARQHTVLEVFDLNGERAGAIHLKAGKVLLAEAGELDGLPAVRELLAAPATFGFVVYRRPQTLVALPLLGSVVDVLMRASALSPLSTTGRSGVHRTAPPPPPARLDEVASIEADELQVVDATDAEEITKVADRKSPAGVVTSSPQPSSAELVVLDGRLSEFDLGSVLQVTGLSRQHTSLRIFDERRQRVGELHLQSGHVLSADAYDQEGVDALRLLLHSPRDFTFVVSRHSDPIARQRRALGTVSELLQAASAPSANVASGDPLQFLPQAGSLVPPTRAGRGLKVLASVGFVLVTAGASFWIGGRLQSHAVSRERSRAESVVRSTVELTPVTQPATGVTIDRRSATPTAALAGSPTRGAQVAPASPTGLGHVREVDALSSVQQSDLLGAAEIGSLQGGLKLLGFHPGPIDGAIGPLTRAAVAAFQQAENLPVDGELSADTQARLTARIRGRDSASDE